ncbi:MAG: malto-oligosyltrehalose trehalohydrolase [SAR324 cluster bacterium]|nr:malto-oligosyltrehalose trehalohydrolase [SAR324 cluster bacterium]
MPFGPQATSDGRFLFKLWAPGAREVHLVHQTSSAESLTLMTPENGWFLLEISANYGDRYGFRLDQNLRVPDPVSRYQPDDVHQLSQLIDPRAWNWDDFSWKGRPWEEAVVYELHVGTFTSEGTFKGVLGKLDYLKELGISAIELMPLSDFPGKRNWGYDGVLHFAPDHTYGTPDELKLLIQSAHAKGLMVFMDVVYNHFGPEGNYLYCHSPLFFNDRHHTPWGSAINFDENGCEWVRKFFIHNALFWLEEYHVDGLRFDAVHAIYDNSGRHILEELAETVAATFPRDRHIHLVLENDKNEAHYLQRKTDQEPRWYVAQWNDDLHHALHILASGEKEGYYRDYARNPKQHLGRCLTEGFAYQGERSAYRNGAKRGEPSTHLPPTAFVSFLQNHDQAGNRAFGERLHQFVSEQAYRAITAIFLLAPSPPLLFMGQEWCCDQPFYFFCDFEPNLAAQVTTGRRNEFAKFPAFSHPDAREKIPDPCAASTFEKSVIHWDDLSTPEHQSWLALHQQLLRIRQKEIIPRLNGIQGGQASFELFHYSRILRAEWTLGDQSKLTLLANLTKQHAVPVKPFMDQRPGRSIYLSHEDLEQRIDSGFLYPWSVAWFLQSY